MRRNGSAVSLTHNSPSRADLSTSAGGGEVSRDWEFLALTLVEPRRRRLIYANESARHVEYQRVSDGILHVVIRFTMRFHASCLREDVEMREKMCRSK